MDKIADDNTAQQPLSNERKILEAAEKEFLLKGFDDARTAVIAEQAGVTQPMLNYYFRSKENLFRRVIAEKTDALCAMLFDLITEEHLPVTHRIVHGAMRHFDFVNRNRELPFFIFTEGRRNPERLKELLATVKTQASELVRTLQNEINHESSNGRCPHFNALMLLHDILALNLTTFVALPAMKAVFDDRMRDEDEYIKARREEIETIIKKRLGLPC